MSQRHKEFKGELKSPITYKKKLPTAPTLLTDSPEISARYDDEVRKYFSNRSFHILTEQLRKLPLLLEHFEISTGDHKVDLLMLVLALAEKNVPGFGYKDISPAGRTEKWNPLLLTKLFLDVEKYKKEKSTADRIVTTSGACSSLIKKEEWKKVLSAKREGSDGKKTLENKYSEAKSSPLVKAIIKDDFNEELYNEITHHLSNMSLEDALKVSRKF